MWTVLTGRRAARVLGLGVIAATVMCCTTAGAAEPAADAHQQAAGLQQAFTEIYQRAAPGIVTVFAETEELPSLAEKLKWGADRVAENLGSGFIIDKRGYLITNEHVVREGRKFSVLMSDGTKYEGRVVGMDQLLDIALVKIIVPRGKRGTRFPTVTLGDSDAVRPGMWAVTIGNPIGFIFDDAAPVISAGIVSGINRTFVRTLEAREGGMRTYGGLIQTDAVINPGNSGGPLLNLEGEVIGVNTLLWSPVGFNVGMGFAVPINKVQGKVRLLKRGYGVKRPMRYGTIDAKLETLNELYADVLHLKGTRGVYVSHVSEGGAAEKGGMQDKDVILTVNGQRVVNDAQLVSLVAHLPVGKPVPFEISRVVDGKPKKMVLNVTLSGKTIREIEAGSLRTGGHD